MEIRRIYSLLKVSFEGETWHGLALWTQLKDVDAEIAFRKAQSNMHSIWELILHIVAWREFATQKLAANDEYELPVGSEKDWPAIADTSPEAWQKTLTLLSLSQQNLLDQIKSMPEAKLEETVPGKNYSFYTLLHGIIQHDIYHGGQIALLKKVHI